jgi:hypothetical protein
MTKIADKLHDAIETTTTNASLDALTDYASGETIDITPRGLKTPEGRARADAAMEVWNESTADVAEKAKSFITTYKDTIVQAAKSTAPADGELLADLKELCDAITERTTKQDAFLRALAGMPAL